MVKAKKVIEGIYRCRLSMFHLKTDFKSVKGLGVKISFSLSGKNCLTPLDK